MAIGDLIILRKKITMNQNIDDGNDLQQIASATLFDNVRTGAITSTIHIHRITREGIIHATLIAAGVSKG